MNKDRAEGIAKQAEGSVKQAAGALLGDAKLKADGARPSKPREKSRTPLAASKMP